MPVYPLSLTSCAELSGCAARYRRDYSGFMVTSPREEDEEKINRHKKF